MTTIPKPSKVARQALEIERLTNALADASRRAEGAQRLARERRDEIDKADCIIAKAKTVLANNEKQRELVKALEAALAEQVAATQDAVTLAQHLADMNHEQPPSPPVPAPPLACPMPHLERRRFEGDRWAPTKTFRIGGKDNGVSAHVHAGERDDGTLGELFVRLGECMDKSIPEDKVDWRGLAIRLGYLARTMCDAWATDLSIAVQCGVPLKTMLDKHIHQQDVCGYTGDATFPHVNGLLDYIARWLMARYVPPEPVLPAGGERGTV